MLMTMPTQDQVTPLRVLVVDDNRPAADTVATLLRVMGHDAQPTYDGRAAISLAESFVPDLVLVDLAMPDMNGFELADELRARWPDTKIIALTAFGQSRVVDETEAAGFDAHLVKPATADELNILLENCRAA
jgi:CheY-like chemotaxis protein